MDGFERVRQLSGVPPEVLLVPLPGHTLGHAGVAIERTSGNWVLQAGDAYFYHAGWIYSIHGDPQCHVGRCK